MDLKRHLVKEMGFEMHSETNWLTVKDSGIERLTVRVMRTDLRTVTARCSD
jgi:hypothetical protein